MPVLDIVETLREVNQCQVDALTKGAETLDLRDDCSQFYKRIRGVEAAVVHSYQTIAHIALREEDPNKAAAWWYEMVSFCDSALKALTPLRQKYAGCGMTDLAELYDLVLDYKGAAQEKYSNNLEDAQCPPFPEGIFPERS